MPKESHPAPIVLLWGQSFSHTQAGAEQFARLLMKEIPGITLVVPEEEFSPLPFLAEPSKALAAAQSLEKKLALLRPKVVLYNGMYGWALPKKTPYKKVALCHGTFASFSKHAMPLNADRVRTQLIYAAFEKHSYANADLIISNSAFTKECLRNDYGLDSKVIPLGVDSNEFLDSSKSTLRKQLQLPLDKKIILFVGRADHYKGFDIVEGIARAHPEWHMVSVTSPRGKSDAVDCRGPLLFAEVVKYYGACDVVVYPSRFESFGLVTIEALMAGRPVVTTPFGVANEINHPYCIRVGEWKPALFAEAIETALKLKSSPSLKKVMQYYDVQRFAQDYRTALEGLQ